MRKKNRLFDNSAVIVLFIICFGLLIVLLRTVLETGESKDSLAVNNPQAGILTDMTGDTQRKAGDDGAGIGDTEGNADAAGSEILDVGNTGNTGEETQLPESGTSGDEMQSPESRNPEGQAPSETPEPEFYEFTVSDKTYFDDALFIGDSRTVGLREYGTLDNADYFASSGLNLYKISETKVKYGEDQEITLDDMLQHNAYGKVYVMLGINELGYNFDTTIEKYREFIDYIFSLQPEAIVYVCANLHVNSLRNEVDEVHNNGAINRMNQAISEFADQKDIFYLDVNPLFDDEEGNLAQEYISDDSHVMGIYYEDWCEWYCENTIVK